MRMSSARIFLSFLAGKLKFFERMLLTEINNSENQRICVI